MKAKDLIFALVQKSEQGVGKLLETLELHFSAKSKSSELTDNARFGAAAMCRRKSDLLKTKELILALVRKSAQRAR
jgi:hypothetical protein